MDTEDASAHLLLALLPTTCMAVIALYIALYMWKYGNDASIVVQSTVCNGWIFLFLGSLALLAGQVPPEVRLLIYTLEFVLGLIVVCYRVIIATELRGYRHFLTKASSGR